MNMMLPFMNRSNTLQLFMDQISKTVLTNSLLDSSDIYLANNRSGDFMACVCVNSCDYSLKRFTTRCPATLEFHYWDLLLESLCGRNNTSLHENGLQMINKINEVLLQLMLDKDVNFQKFATNFSVLAENRSCEKYVHCSINAKKY